MLQTTFAEPRTRRAHQGNTDQRDKRKHFQLPLRESPLFGVKEDELIFSQREQSHPLELFFDLSFVANLTTFTHQHQVTNGIRFLSYIGFFAVIWTTWFQTTLHDVRFARDSIYERACKTLQFLIFVGFALVGAELDPSGDATSNRNFFILTWLLTASRILFALQYLVVLWSTVALKSFRKLCIPLGLTITVFVTSAIVFGLLSLAFHGSDLQISHLHVYIVWWVMLALEAVFVILISCKWRMISFKRTHLVERMGLLTIIVIGEGAIGVTRDVANTMGNGVLDVEGSILVFCAFLLLIYIWALYFDNRPTYHYGTIRQQFWSVLHFPLHLAIIGVVEGSSRMTLARYMLKQYTKLRNTVSTICLEKHLEGTALKTALNDTINYFHFDAKPETLLRLHNIEKTLDSIGNDSSRICSQTSTPMDFPPKINVFLRETLTALSTKLHVEVTEEAEHMNENESPLSAWLHTWDVAYTTYFAAVALLLFTLAIYIVMTCRSYKTTDIHNYAAFFGRIAGSFVAVVLLAFGVSEQNFVLWYLNTALVVPTVLAIMSIIVLVDWITAWIANKRLQKVGRHQGKSSNPPSPDWKTVGSSRYTSSTFNSCTV